jgi:hypothetical protein
MYDIEISSTDNVNPFQAGGNIVNAGQGSVADTQVATKELGEIQARVFLSKQFGRNQAASYDKIMTACQRVGLASVAIYTYSRGGTDINGPSIRLAEEIARDWGNIDYGWTELERRRGESTLRAYAWDLETNAYKQITFVVPLQRTKKNGNERVTVPITDERDIYELLANNAARRMRNCILAIVPSDIVEDAVDQCHRTLVTRCELTPERLLKMVTAFSAFGVTKGQIEKRIQRKLESIAPAQFVRLTEIYNSLKDGMSEPADWFETVEAIEPDSTPSAAETLKASLKLKPASKAAKAVKAVKAPEPPQAIPAPEQKPEQATEAEEPEAEPQLPVDPAEAAAQDLFNRIAGRVEETKTAAGLTSLYNSVNGAVSTGELNVEQGNALLSLIENREQQLKP